ncbi:hypothetical protein ACHAW5_000791 [Stephanodiscus triporus]|uniref:Uncharacterized protein n=1 Tax=Stephanodiscus triporus TaxID=2934178 RepID=A0ABD3QGD9_9STRA
MAASTETTSLVRKNSKEDEGELSQVEGIPACYSTVKQQLKTAGYSPSFFRRWTPSSWAPTQRGTSSGKLGDTFNPTTVLAIDYLEVQPAFS